MRPIKKVTPDDWHKLNPDDVLQHRDVQFALIDHIGAYCSYCEKVLGSREVEHYRLSKEWKTPLFKKDWEHMLLICGDCRNHKTKEVLSQQEHDEHLWPDLHPSFHLNNSSPINYEKRKVTHTIMNGDDVASKEEKEMVVALSNPNSEYAKKAQNTIDLFQLNTPFYDHKKSKITTNVGIEALVLDHRMEERNLAWQEAEAAIDRIKNVQELMEEEKLESMLDLFHQQISLTAVAKGNWSIWMTVFWKEFQDPELLHKLFIERSGANGRVHFLGTHHQSIKWH